MVVVGWDSCHETCTHSAALVPVVTRYLSADLEEQKTSHDHTEDQHTSHDYNGSTHITLVNSVHVITSTGVVY